MLWSGVLYSKIIAVALLFYHVVQRRSCQLGIYDYTENKIVTQTGHLEKKKEKERKEKKKERKRNPPIFDFLLVDPFKIYSK